MRTRIVAISVFALLFALLIPAVVIGGSETDGVATLDRIEAWQAPANETGFEDAADIRGAIEDGTLSRATGVNGTHLLVVELGFAGFGDEVGEANGSTTTEQFQSAFREHGDLAIQQTNMGLQADSLVIDTLNGTGVTVYPDQANGTYFLAINLNNATAYRNDSPEKLKDDVPYEFDIRASLAADSSLTDAEQVAKTAVTSRAVSVETAPDSRVQLRSLANQTITGTTNLGTGSTVTVVITGDTNPGTDANESFRLAREAPVDLVEDELKYEGKFDVTFDMTEISPAATNVSVDVQVADRSMLETPVPARINEYISVVDAQDILEGGGSAGVNVNGSLSAGGFFVLHANSADGPVVGHSPYLEPGAKNVTVYVDRPVDADELVVVAYRDANYNEWFDGPETDTPYPGQESADTAQFTAELSNNTPVEPTPTATPTDSTPTDPTPTATETPPLNETTPGDDTPELGDTGPESSGVFDLGSTIFQVGGILVAALLLVALLRVRD